MLEHYNSVLLLSDNELFCKTVSSIAEELGVKIRCEAEWKKIYRVREDIIICGSKYLDSINEAFIPCTTVILKQNEEMFQYVRIGINRFIFDYRNKDELKYSMMKMEKEYIAGGSEDLQLLLSKATYKKFIQKDYDFQFDRNIYRYKGKLVYFSDFQKCYLARWLLLGIKDNSKRTHLCLMRKKFGRDFLADIDRFGGVKGGNDEQ